MDRTQIERDKRYRATMRGKYICAKRRAKQRGVEWKLTYDQFVRIWTESGKWHLRGNKRGCYVMGRAGDEGAYEVGNVAIIPFVSNVSERNTVHHRKMRQAGVKRRHTANTTTVSFEDQAA